MTEVNWNYADLMKKGREFYINNRKFKSFLKGIVDLNGNESILDVGCGIGTVPRLLLKINKNLNDIKGIDIDKNLIEWGNKHWGKSNKIKLYEGNIYNLEFMNDTIDIITSFGLLEWLKKPNDALDEIIRVCKQNGTILTLVIEKSKFEKLPQDKNYNKFYEEYLKGVKDFGCPIENEGNYIQDLFHSRGLENTRYEFIFETEFQITEKLIELWERSMVEEEYLEFTKKSMAFYFQFLKRIGWNSEKLNTYIKENLSFRNMLDLYNNNIGKRMIQRSTMVILKAENIGK
ncbi:MAG: class I SAM-dependent methyltransferase [Promethearchaeota archaeon]|nr:MAG: class I SAM-dependent methyltransferase [Candidatus Lokiarchaeota archaeon]